jgi:Bacterial PH domain
MSTSTPESIPDGEAPAPRRPGLNQPITGVVPPQLAEAKIRTAWPSVTDASPAIANLGRALIRTIVLAPLAWLLLAPFYFKKVLPFLAKRYTLTNRRLMVQRGLKAKPKQEVALSDIDDVRLVEGSYNPFYRAATLEVLSGGKVVLTLTGVPEPEAFRQSTLNAVYAWVPGKSRALPMIPASATADK